MFRNYFIISLRNILRRKGYSILNIVGLAIGIAAFILIFLHIIDELSYDRFHRDADRIYRVSVNGVVSGDALNVAVSAAPTGEAMVRDIPSVINFTRVDQFPQSVHFSWNERNYYQEGLLFVDSTFFDIFSFRMIRGNPNKALVEPYSLVLTEDVAYKFFGKEDPLGKIILMNNNAQFTITGVVENPPENIHFGFEALASFSTMIEMNGKEAYENWGSLSLYTYVLLAKGADPIEVEKSFPELYLKYMTDLSELENIKFEPFLQPLTSIHLHSNLMAELETNSDIAYVYAFLAIAVFILLIACINFMNLSTARSVKRAREVGMRKVVGAYRLQLVYQFLGESIVMSFVALVLSLILVEISLPTFNHLMDKSLSLELFSHWEPIFLLLALVFVIGIIAGSYPAFYLSAFKPVSVLKGGTERNPGKPTVRNILVIFQFAISIFLIISTSFVYRQLSYLRTKKLGFTKEQVMIIPLRGQQLLDKTEVMKAEMKRLSCVLDIASSRFVPGRDMDGSGFIPEGFDDNNPIIIFNNEIDHDFIKTMQMKIIAGRDFDRNYSTDSAACIINQTLATKLGWEQPLNKRLTGFRRTGSFELKVIGLVEDFHFRSLHDVIEPSVMFLGENNNRFLIVRMAAGNPENHLRMIREKWNELVAAMPFDYYFLDEDFDNLYTADQRVGEIFIFFTFIAIIIACLGLFGLASYNAEQKRKEIGIRKALGSSVPKIVFMLSRQFTKWVIIANVIAWPAAYLFMHEWLSNFAYSITVAEHMWIFILSALMALAIALMTVAYQAVKAALINPIDAIKYE